MSGLPTAKAAKRPGVAGAVLGLVTVLAVSMIGATSLTGFDPADWVRVGSVLAFIAGLPATVILSVAGLRGGARCAAIAGLMLAAIALAAIAVLFAVAG